MRVELPQQWEKITIKGVVFDMDGVLVDTSPCHAIAYGQLWQSLKIDGPGYASIAGRSTKAVVSEYAASLSSEEQREAVTLKQSAALEILAKTDVGFTDVASALERLSSTNIPMAIATSASKASADLVLKRLDIRNYFQEVVTSADVERSKPAPDLFVKAINKIDIDAAEVLILEDSVSGIAAALASGAYAVTVRQAETLTDELRNHSRFLGHFDTVGSVIDTLVELLIHYQSKTENKISSQSNKSSESV